ncbi:MAG: (Fe-S)-binding protein [Fusobacterium sp.]|nr:(Fe-S)-binding protein [Fusobacterium sp.]
MKKLKDFEKEINKCSKCGLCQGACPIYKLTGNECAVSKGKFVMLSGVLKGDLQLNANINSYLDLCTKCGKCSNFCPAGIDVCEILQTAKYEYISKQHSFKLLQLFHKVFDRIVRLCHSPFRAKSSGSHEIIYFKGCVNQIFPKTENALKKILNRADIKLVDADFSCCGLPFFSAGNLEQFEEVKQRNSELINNSAADTILTDCASCESTLKSYGTINKNLVNAESLIADLGLKFKFKKHYKVAFHKPCHLENTDFLKELTCENVEFIDIPETCCGLAGEFFLKKPEIANKIAKQRAEEIINSGAEIVLTSCPACVIGLKKALLGKVKVMKIIEFLEKGL